MPAMLPPRSAARHYTDTDEEEELRSTWSQRAWTLAGSVAVLSTLATSVSLAMASPTDLLGAAMATVASYCISDLASGVYHWTVDNYGDAATPVLGAQIEAFQSHHRHPYVIARRDTCNNLHAPARAVALGLPAVGAALAACGAGAAAHAFASTMAACVLLSQQFHAWAHEKPSSRLPPGVGALQAAGVLVSRSQHARHHRPPNNVNYCIVSGMWNHPLHRFKVFEAMEKVIYLLTGAQPRSWAEPNTKWTTEPAEDDDTAAKTSTP